MKRYRNLEILIARAAILIILVGLVLLTGAYTGKVNFRAFTLLTVWNALLALVFLLLNNKYVKQKKHGILSKEWQFMILFSMINTLLVALVFLEPTYQSLTKTEYIGMILLQKVLPAVMYVHYLVGPHKMFETNTNLYGVVYIVIYFAVAILAGNSGVQFSFGTANYPMPFLNVDQLGMGLVLANAAFLTVASFVIGYVIIFIDCMSGGKNDL